MGSASTIRAGAAYVEFFIRDKVTRNIDKIGKKIRGFGTKIAGLGAGMAGVGAAIAAPFAATIKAASDMEEVMNKFNVVFGDSAKEVKAWSDQFAASMGRSKKQVADFMSSSQDLFVPLGFGADAALDLSKQVTGLAVDLASFNNKADADVLNDLHAALTGSGEVMKKYGVVLSEAAVKAELLNQAIDPKTATNQQKAQARFNIILRGTTAAQGDALRSAGSFANRMKALKARVEDTQVSIGTALLPTIRDFVGKVVQIVAKIAEWTSKNAGIIRTVAGIAAAITASGAALFGIGATIALVGKGISMAAAVIGALLSPIGLVAAALGGLTAAWLTMTNHGRATVGSLLKWFKQLKDYAVETWQGIAAALKAGDLKLAAKIAWIELKLVWQRGVNAISKMWFVFKEGLLSVFDGVVTWIRTNWTKMTGWLGEQIAKVTALFTGQSSSEMARMVEEDTQRRVRALQKEKQERDRARMKATQASYDEADAELEALKKERDEALKRAKTLKEQAEDTPPELKAADDAAEAAIKNVGKAVTQMVKSPEALIKGSLGAAQKALENKATQDAARTADASERTAQSVERIEQRSVILAPARGA